MTSLEYTYSGTTGLLSKLSANLTGTSIPVTYSYNGLNQISGKTINGKFRRAYAYDTFGEYTKSIPQYVNYRDMNGSLIFGEKYLYDANGRIKEVCEPETPYGTLATYGYDVQGQLTTAEAGGTSYTYTYDTAGNILTSSDGEETHEYSYGNSTWRDLLTAYDGQEIGYDGCGNPVSYYDGSTFTWTQGRRLAGYANGDTDISYAYDMAGVRSSKTVNGTEYRFTTLSGLVTRQEWDGNSIDFVYDENNQPLAMKYNNTLYYYILNVQGDVIALADQNGTLIAKYSYDPWGKLLKVTSNGWLEEQNAYYLKVAEANPLRYRGYYYDYETGFYYLQSRYYDPAIGRFINADSYASTNTAGILNSNMFAYCENDPVNKSDDNGYYSFLCREDERDREAKRKYNKKTVNIYVSGEGAEVSSKLNIELYGTENSSYMNMSVGKSVSINSVTEINAVIDVIIDSEYYSRDAYGSKSFMRGQWVVHNACYRLATSSELGYKIAVFVAANDDVIESSKSLDLRPKDNVTKRGMLMYTIMGILT